MPEWPLIKRLLPSVKKRWAALTWTDGFKVFEAEGLKFLLNYKNYVDRQVYLYGGYEADRLAFSLEQIQKLDCKLFLDVGANFGLYSLIVADRTNVSEIHAFEPDPRNFAQLHANLYLNRMVSRIHTHKCAIGDVAGKAMLALFDETSSGKSKLVAGTSGLEVDVKPLDDCVDARDTRIAVKIDVEGHEGPALKGMAQLLKSNECVIQVESFPENIGEISALMDECGYRRLHQIDDDYYFTNADRL